MKWPWSHADHADTVALSVEKQDLAAEFRSTLADVRPGQPPNPELLPDRLMRACAAVLPVSAAGLSLIAAEFRVPLGASDEQAGAAERLQFTQGEGPCIEATRTGRLQVSDQLEIERRWPSFAHELFLTTPYRAVICLPLPLGSDMGTALDLYLHDPQQVSDVQVAQISTIGDQIVDALQLARAMAGAAELPGDDTEPAWMHSPAAQDRLNVWIGIGMLIGRLQLPSPDALDVLRGYAFAHDTDVDSVSALLVQRKLDIEDVIV